MIATSTTSTTTTPTTSPNNNNVNRRNNKISQRVARRRLMVANNNNNNNNNECDSGLLDLNLPDDMTTATPSSSSSLSPLLNLDNPPTVSSPGGNLPSSSNIKRTFSDMDDVDMEQMEREEQQSRKRPRKCQSSSSSSSPSTIPVSSCYANNNNSNSLMMMVMMQRSKRLNDIYQKLCLLMQRTFHASPDKTCVNQCDMKTFLALFFSDYAMYPDYAPEGRLTLLYIASVYGQYDVLQFLLTNGARHNVIFKEHFTPVHVCARSGFDKCLKLLLEHGADYTVETTIGNRAIHIAATYGHLECIKLLVQSGEQIDNNFTRNGVTPLQCAITHDRVDVLQWLLEKGANPMIGRYEMESVFMAYADGTLTEDHFRQILPIHVACRFNSVKCLKVLLDWGIDVNLRDEKQRTPLHTACLFNSEAAIKMILKHKGCDASIKDKQGAQPLHILFSLDSEKNFLTVAKACKLEEKHLVHIWQHTQLQYKPKLAKVIQQVVRSE